jgi:hypothetical protein
MYGMKSGSHQRIEENIGEMVAERGCIINNIYLLVGLIILM